jgi:hypothetical protein
MKKVFLVITILVIATALKSQSTNEEIDYIQAIFGMEKRAALMDLIDFKESEEEGFWRLYDEYEVIRKEYGKQRIRLLNSSIEKFNSISDKESDEWIKEVIDLRNKNERLIEKYYKKIRKECSATLAMQFYQFESYVLAGIRFQILETLPF